MANRILLGNRGGTYGLFVSKPGSNVISCDDEDLMFDSRKGKYAQVLANQNGSGSAQSVTVSAGKRLMVFINPSDSRCRHYATQTIPSGSNTMSITVSNGVRYVLMNIEAGDS